MGSAEGARGKSYVSRGGLKMEHALREFGIDPTGTWCADLGCSTGGFTDCLLQHGAERVYSVDTGYGVLGYRLRMDERVVVHERTNALHFEPPDEVRSRGGVDLVTVDMSWTVQEKCLPAALGWLCGTGQIISLVKPHYEATSGPYRHEYADLLVDGVLAKEDSLRVLDLTIRDLPRLGFTVLGCCESPVLGGRPKAKKARRAGSKSGSEAKTGTGNTEYLVLLTRTAR